MSRTLLDSKQFLLPRDEFSPSRSTFRQTATPAKPEAEATTILPFRETETNERTAQRRTKPFPFLHLFIRFENFSFPSSTYLGTSSVPSFAATYNLRGAVWVEFEAKINFLKMKLSVVILTLLLALSFNVALSEVQEEGNRSSDLSELNSFSMGRVQSLYSHSI